MTYQQARLMERVLQCVMNERYRQEQFKADGEFQYSCMDVHPDISNYRKATILGEEMGEVCNVVNELDNVKPDGNDEDLARLKSALRQELIQVAAVAVAWVESLQ